MKKKTAKKAGIPRTGGTLMHLGYHPERGIVRANLEHTHSPGDQTLTHGQDVDIAINDLSADIRNALVDAFNWTAADLGAIPYEKPEEE